MRRKVIIGFSQITLDEHLARLKGGIGLHNIMQYECAIQANSRHNA